MNRKQKTESIRLGEAVIKNDLQGDERCLEVLNECETAKGHKWQDISFTKGDFYGTDSGGYFYYLFKSELNNRPQILMSELVETSYLRQENDNISIFKNQASKVMRDFNFADFKRDYPSLLRVIERSMNEAIKTCSTEKKEVFTVEHVQQLIAEICETGKPKIMSDKLNKMAFEAYKK